MQIKTNDACACGKRIKMTRLLAGLSRKDMEETFFVSASTLQAWEIGKNPLNEKAAKKLIDIFRSKMLICSSEWLLYGIGNPPQIYNQPHYTQFNSNIDILVNWDDEISIQKEIGFFSKTNNDAIVMLVTDDGMEPFYFPGDYVGGKKRFSNHINSVIDMNCIVQLKDQSIYIRKIKKSKNAGLYNLFCNNPNTILHEPVLYEIDLIFAAPIIWHRKNDPKTI